MARFRSIAAFVIGHARYKAGTTFADTQGNAVAGDVIWAGCGLFGSMSPALVPLDGAATTVKNASVFANYAVPCTISGVNSVEG
jgi:hypothetical protein